MDSVDFSKSGSHVTIYALSPRKKCINPAYKFFTTNDSNAPARIHHFGVAVFQKFYHFSQEGIVQNHEISYERDDHLPSGETTQRTREEFESWLVKPDIRDRFRAQNYHPTTNSCIDFVLEACNFLGVEVENGLINEIHCWAKQSCALKFLLKSTKVKKWCVGIDVDGKERGPVGEIFEAKELEKCDEEDTPKDKVAVDSRSKDFSDEEFEMIVQLLSCRVVREFLGISCKSLPAEWDGDDEVEWKPYY